MLTNIEAARSAVVDSLRRRGFCLCERLLPELNTTEIGEHFGSVVDIPSLLPTNGIATVQSLTPKRVDEAKPNNYSGNYGLGTFPLHTDLAHWAVPPRYFALRCYVGANDVFTNVLPWAPIIDTIGARKLRRAVFAVRKQRLGFSGLLRGMQSYQEADLLRWDPIFLRPANECAEQMATVMRDPKWTYMSSGIPLRESGDTLFVDNWRVLHGRTAVPSNSLSRRVERVYLSEVLQ